MRRRLWNRIAPERRIEDSVTLNGEPYAQPFSWVMQINAPSYIEPQIPGLLVVAARRRRYLFGRVPLRVRVTVLGVWQDGLDPVARLLEKKYQP